MDKRGESRVESQLRFFINVNECDADPDLVGQSITCTGVDFSAHGLQIKAEHILPSDTKINITIGLGEPFSMYLLNGIVRWSRSTNSGTFMGILLQNMEGTDYANWTGRFNELFERV